MAGAGYKLFNTGDVLTAAQVNTYLQEQTVMVFANSTARTTALSGVLAEGMVTYLKDTDVMELYNGSAWVGIAADQTPLTTKGDLFTYSTADARLAVGNNGETLVADSSATTGLRWQSNFAAGKNKIINGDFNIWQRGTSFTPASSINTYTADRFLVSRDGTGATVTVSRQSFTPGTAPVSGYENAFFFRYAQTVAGTGGTYLTVCSQNIEDVRTFAGQTITYSFWAKADTTRTLTVGYAQQFGSGGSSTVYGAIGSTITLTTSWARYSVTGSIPSISGKTVGTSSYLEIYISGTPNSTQTIDFWGVQAEIGSTTTAFQTATGTLSGELAACQRYYYRTSSTSSNPYAIFSQAFGANSTTQVFLPTKLPVTMRVAPTSIDYANLQLADGSNLATVTSVTAIDANTTTQDIGAAGYSVASGLTQYRPYVVRANNSSAAYIAFNAEL